MAERYRYCYRELLPFAAMLLVECTNVGLNILFKAAAQKGMSYYVFIVYSYAIATLALLPFSIISHRRTALPPPTFLLFYRICLLGLIGFSAQIFGFKGIEYSSPTLASAISNLTPAFTFILAVIFRMEKFDWRRSRCRAKIIGTIVSISGALGVILYKGAAIILNSSPCISLHWPVHYSQSEWVTGGLLLSAEYLLLPFWYIIQANIMQEYPDELVVVFFYNLCATIVSAPVCLIAESNLRAWRVKPDIALAAILYSGLSGSSLGTAVHTWGLRLKGPVYIALFRPLSIAIAAVMGVFFLGDTLYLGCVLGAIMISIGFYAVTWGKAKEERLEHCGSGGFITLESSSSTQNVPLLRSSCIQDI